MRRIRLLLLAWALAAAGGCSITEDVLVFGPGPSPWTEPESRWSIEHPVFGAERLLGACLGPDGRATIVGTNGLLLHDDGRGWRLERAPRVATVLLAVIDAGDVVLAAGEDGVVLRRLGREWVREDTGTDATLRALARGPDGAIWAAGDGGTLLRRDGSGWANVACPEPWFAGDDLTALATVGDTLAIGFASGRVLGHAGGGWRYLGRPDNLGVIGMAAFPDGRLFVSNGRLRCYQAGRWTEVSASGGPISRVAAAGGVLLFCGGYSSVMPLFLSAQPDTYSWHGYLSYPTALALDEQGRALVVNQDGEIMRRRDGEWRLDPAGAGLFWYARPLLDGSCLLAASREILELRDGSWRRAAIGPAGFRSGVAIDGFAAADYFCLGTAAWRDEAGVNDYRTVLWRQQGLTGEEIPLPAPVAPRLSGASLAVDASGDLFLTGNQRGVWRYSRGVWSRELAPPDSNGKWSVQRTAAGQVFAWDGQRAWRWSGERWRPVEGVVAEAQDPVDSQVIPRFAGHGAGPLVVLRERSWGVAEEGAGAAWSWRRYPISSMRYRDSSVAWAEGRSRLFLDAGQTRSVYSLGTDPGGERAWTPAASLPPEGLRSLHAETDGSLIGVGSRTGRVYRYRAAQAAFDPAP